MAEFDMNKATTVGLVDTPSFILDAQALDVENDSGETFWYFDKAAQNFSYYLQIPEIHSSANSLANWAFGKGFGVVPDTNTRLKVLLGYIDGKGFDTFETIMWNMQVVKKVVGDAFCEIIRDPDTGELWNLVPISPERVKIIFNSNLTIDKPNRLRYEIWNGEKWVKIAKKDMLHLSNNRIGDQIHGTSQIDSCKWIIDARNEALLDNRKIEHRGMALGIAYYKTNNEGKIAFANATIAKAVRDGDMVGLPEDTVEIKAFPQKSIGDRMDWIRYLENFFYQTFGVPRSIATSEGLNEVGGKMGHVNFEIVYGKEQNDMEDILWQQLGIKVKFNRPPSLGGLQEEEAKNTGQIRIQPNDVEASLTRE